MQKFFRIATVLVLAIACHAQAHAQANYPNRPIRVIHGGPPGSGLDNLIRSLAPAIEKALGGATLIIEPKPGATGLLANNEAHKAAADGYTVLINGLGQQVIVPELYKNVPYDARKEFAQVAKLAEVPALFVVSADNKDIDTMDQLARHLKANAGKVTFSSGGNGSFSHLCGVMFAKLIGAEIVHVPYKASLPSLMGIAGGEGYFSCDVAAPAFPLISAGKLKPLMVTTDRPYHALPKVATVVDAKMPQLKMSAWFGVAVKKGTPEPVIERLASAVQQAINAPGQVEKLEKLGYEVKFQGPRDYERFVRSEVERWNPIIKESGAKIE